MVKKTVEIRTPLFYLCPKMILNKYIKISTLEKYLYPRAESNRNRQNRNLKFYPLNYGGKRKCKYNNFLYFCELYLKE